MASLFLPVPSAEVPALRKTILSTSVLVPGQLASLGLNPLGNFRPCIILCCAQEFLVPRLQRRLSAPLGA